MNLRRCSLTTLLVVFCGIAGFFGGYRHGFERGYEGGRRATVQETFLRDASFTINHDILPLMLGQNQAGRALHPDFLIALIEDVVPSSKPIDLGSGELVVTTTGQSHEEIAALLDQLSRLPDSELAKLEERVQWRR